MVGVFFSIGSPKAALYLHSCWPGIERGDDRRQAGMAGADGEAQAGALHVDRKYIMVAITNQHSAAATDIRNRGGICKGELCGGSWENAERKQGTHRQDESNDGGLGGRGVHSFSDATKLIFGGYIVRGNPQEGRERYELCLHFW